MLKVKNNQYLQRNGKDFFYLADTMWSLFTNASEEQYRQYLKYRKEQGFNAIQINLLPQWDRSVSKSNSIEPFLVKGEYYDIENPNKDYFQKVEKYLEITIEFDFVPVLVLVWGNYIEPTWMGERKLTPYIAKEDLQKYTIFANKLVERFNPVYFISGDINFPLRDTIDSYTIVLDTLKKVNKKALTTMHISGDEICLPKEIAMHDNLDIYTFQSGHNFENYELPYTIPHEFRQLPDSKPLFNSEPAYEQMPYKLNQHKGRFTQFDVRRLAYSSVFSGANMGVTYGAHGLWSFCSKETRDYGENGDEIFPEPFLWSEALTFPGANDYCNLKKLAEKYCLYKTHHIDQFDRKEMDIRALEDDNNVYVYVPYNRTVRTNYKLTNQEILGIDLRTNKHFKNEICNGEIKMSNVLEDCVYIISKEK